MYCFLLDTISLNKTPLFVKYHFKNYFDNVMKIVFHNVNIKFRKEAATPDSRNVGHLCQGSNGFLIPLFRTNFSTCFNEGNST